VQQGEFDGDSLATRAIVITGTDSAYVPVVNGLLWSVKDYAAADSVEIGILDLGLSTDDLEHFKQRGLSVVAPDWDYDPAIFRAKPPLHFKGMTARPHLPKYFPGYDIYIWLDADTWVQDWNAIRTYIGSAERAEFVVTPECDRSYSPFYSGGHFAGWYERCLQFCFNDRFARQLSCFPIVNSGAFAAKVGAPHWQEWSRLLGEILKLKREAFFFSEQTALNAVIRATKVSTAFLPSTYNWICNRAMPMCSEDGKLLLEPNPPFQSLGVIHLTSNTKNGRWPLVDIAGKAHSRSLRFKGYDETQVGPDVILPINPAETF
jgi:hypothetical protein